MRLCFWLFLLFALPIAALSDELSYSEQGARALYVAPAGSDANPGTVDKPFASLEKARDYIRANPRSDVPSIVYLRGGTYVRSTTFELKKQDSGTPDAPIIYAGYPGEKVVLSGGIEIPSAALKPVTDSLARALIPKELLGQVRQVDLTQFGMSGAVDVHTPGKRMELFGDGKLLTLSAWPNGGFATVDSVVPTRPIDIRGSVGDAVGVMVLNNGRMERWAHEAYNLLLYGYWFWDWADDYCGIDSIDASRQMVWIKPPYHWYGYRKMQRYCALNLLSEIDVAGEWCFDKRQQKLFVNLSGGISQLLLSRLSGPLITMDEVQWVVLRALSLQHSRGSGLQAKRASHIAVQSCSVNNVGGDAIQFESVDSSRIENSQLYALGKGGISVSGGSSSTLRRANTAIANNLIYSFGRSDKTYTPGVSLSGCGIDVVNNTIHDAPHSAIIFSGNDHLIGRNHIYDVCKETADAGFIYGGRDWTARGTLIVNNYLHDSPKGFVQGIYLDDCLSGITSRGNIIENITNAFWVGGGRDNRFENNFIANCQVSITIDNRGLNWQSASAGPGGVLQKNLLEKPYQTDPWRTRFPLLVEILSDEPAVPKGNVLLGNVMVATKEPTLAAEVVANGVIEGTTVKAASSNLSQERESFCQASAIELATLGYQSDSTRVRRDVQFSEQPPATLFPPQSIQALTTECRVIFPRRQLLVKSQFVLVDSTGAAFVPTVSGFGDTLRWYNLKRGSYMLRGSYTPFEGQSAVAILAQPLAVIESRPKTLVAGKLNLVSFSDDAEAALQALAGTRLFTLQKSKVKAEVDAIGTRRADSDAALNKARSGIQCYLETMGGAGDLQGALQEVYNKCASQDDALEHAAEFAEVTPDGALLTPGMGYWVIPSAPLVLGKGGSAKRVMDSQVQTLQQGWNLIGSPYPHHMYWQSEKLVLWRWDALQGGYRLAGPRIEPWEGYLVYSPSLYATGLPLGDVPQDSMVQQQPFAQLYSDDSRDWMVRPVLRGKDALDSENYIGVLGKATGGSGFGEELIEPPRLDGKASLYVRNPASSQNGRASDIRRQHKALHLFELFMRCGEREQKPLYTLSFEGMEKMNGTTKLYMVHEDSLVEITANTEYAMSFTDSMMYRAVFVSSTPDFRAHFPRTYALHGAAPNPVRTSTMIRYSVPYRWQADGRLDMQGTPITISVFDLQGRLVATVLHGRKSPGHYSVYWDGKGNTGRRVSAGNYVVRMASPDFQKSAQLMVVR